jgi:hypothetical protein
MPRDVLKPGEVRRGAAFPGVFAGFYYTFFHQRVNKV